jgi:hypothetical protein
MTDKELYLKKKQAELDIWAADLAKLRAHASKASAEIQLDMHKITKALGIKIDESKALLSDLSKTSSEAWESVKTNVESTWNSLKCSIGDAKGKCAENTTKAKKTSESTKLIKKL